MTDPTIGQVEFARKIAHQLYPGVGFGIAYDAAIAAIMETQDRVAALEGALAWAMSHSALSYARRIKGQNENWCDQVDKARSILSLAQQGNEFSLSRQQERMDDVERIVGT